MKLSIALALAASLCYSHAYPALEEDALAKTLTYERDIDPESHNYHYSYTTSNGITREEYGEYVPGVNEDGEPTVVLKAYGTFSWVGPDGVKYETSYTADDLGYRVDENEPAVAQQVKNVNPTQVNSRFGQAAKTKSSRAPVKVTSTTPSDEEDYEEEEEEPTTTTTTAAPKKSKKNKKNKAPSLPTPSSNDPIRKRLFQ